MKESIGSTQLFIIVITLILIFTAIMSFTLKKSNAFAMKDKIINAIEKEEGFNDDAIKSIKAIFEESGYRQTGTCLDGTTGYNRAMEMTSGKNQAAFCIKKISATTGVDLNIGETDEEAGNVQKYYYEITVFYGLQLPVVDENINFKMTSKTKGIKGVDD